MSTIKSYTDLEQSKKLAEILPLESADMCYIKHSSSDNPTWEFNEDFPPMILGDVPINEITAETLPCWSLAALFNVLPDTITSNYGIAFKLNIKKSIIEYSNPSLYLTYISIKAYNPIDGCVEMILKLNELKLYNYEIKHRKEDIMTDNDFKKIVFNWNENNYSDKVRIGAMYCFKPCEVNNN